MIPASPKAPESSGLTPVLTIPWLRRLRWTAALGQAGTVLYVVGVLKVPLPLVPVFACIGMTAVSNVALHRIPAGQGERPSWIAAVLAVDVLLLTALLHLCGGPHNPFSSFYLVHVALAAVALPPAWTALIAAVCSVGYGLLFLGRTVLPIPSDNVCGVGPSLPLEIHLRGMLISFVLTTAGVVFFAGRLQQQLRRHEAELVRVRAQAAQNERFAALATLAAGAAHELGTPLGTIAIAAGELVRGTRDLPEHPELSDDAELIREEAARCRAILDRLEQQEGDTSRELTVPSIVEGLRRRFGADAVVLDLGKAPATVLAPPEALSQALASLVQNALDSSRAGGGVHVRISAEPGGTEFSIEDQGAGLSEEARIHAGEPFFTTKATGQGMGLGLFLVKLLAQRLNGEFQIVNRPSGGARAVLRLPSSRP